MKYDYETTIKENVVEILKVGGLTNKYYYYQFDTWGGERKSEKKEEKTVKPIDSNRTSIVEVEIGDGKCNPYLWLNRWNIMHTML